MNKYNLTTLKNGLKVITVPIKGLKTVTVGISVSVGSDYESKSENGLSHFLEHMFFKGTKNRTAKMMRKEIEAMGAHHNAYTSSFLTFYYIDSHIKFFKKALSILADALKNSTFPEGEIEKERGVILSEIDRAKDQPRYLANIALNKLLYKDQKPGQEILGPKSNIKKFTRDDFLNFRGKHYDPKQVTICVAGDLKNKDILKEVKTHFENIESLKKTTTPPKNVFKQRRPQVSVVNKKTEQTHIMAGFRTFSRFDKKAPVLEVMNIIFGALSSSRLFDVIREQMGLAYVAYSFTYFGYDYGDLTVYMGVDHKNATKAVKALVDQINLLKKEGITDKELKSAKAYLLGSQARKYESVNNLANFYGNQLSLMFKKIKTPREEYEDQRKVTKKQIDNLAKEIFKNSNMNLAVVGPHTKAKFQKIFKL